VASFASVCPKTKSLISPEVLFWEVAVPPVNIASELISNGQLLHPVSKLLTIMLILDSSVCSDSGDYQANGRQARSPHARISLQNKAPDAFEGVAKPQPKKTIEASPHNFV